MSSAMAAFKLSKWYLDCVTDSGDVTIAYTGVLDWRFVHLGFSSLLETTSGGVRERHTLRDQIPQQIESNSISWTMKRLKIDAVWQSNSAAVRETIFESKEGSVDWHCQMPHAHARLSSAGGLGYVECLTMTIPPWKIPIRQLRWGRFLSNADWIVWIDWEGDFYRRLVYRNGKAVPNTTLDDWGITFENGELLTMTDPLTLRSGPLGATALSAIPGVEKIFPGRLLRVNECKWRSQGQLRKSTGETVVGWAIHERVTWPK